MALGRLLRQVLKKGKEKLMQEILIVALIVVIGILIYQYSSAKQRDRVQKEAISNLQTEIQYRAQQQYDTWRERECDVIRNEQRDVARREAIALLQQWKMDQEQSIRTDAINRSQFVTVGKVTEHIAPYLPDFKFNPKDARFIGSPIDFLVFDGLDEGGIRDVFFIEVKTGFSSSLNTRQRQIRDAVQSGRVKWIELRINH
jgi:predicted Holliday junction resolvase-like endonuclease